jgi:hypothetical protein
MPYLLSFFKAHYCSKKKPPTLSGAWWLCLVYKEILNILKHKHSIFFNLVTIPVNSQEGFSFCFLFLERRPVREFASKNAKLKLSAASHRESSILKEQYHLVFARLPENLLRECARYRIHCINFQLTPINSFNYFFSDIIR